MQPHPLFTTLKNLRGNARGCVYTEPLWGIPYNLYFPYISVFMLALGLTDSQIGLVISIGWGFQIITGMVSGIITDRLGRKRTVILFDMISWSIPTIIWAFSQSFNYFVIAAIFNSFWRIPMNAWTCLLVEDSDPAQLVDIYSWIYIAGLLAAFFAPLATLLVQKYSLIPTMRGLYLLSTVMMTAKFFIMNAMVHETPQGLARMHETRNQPLLQMIREYGGVFNKLLRTPQTLYTLGIMLILSIGLMINNSFWSIIVTQRMGIPEKHLALFAFAKSLIMLVFFFRVIPRISRMDFKVPMLGGFCAYIISHLILINIPGPSYLLLLVSTFLEACGYAALNPLLDRMVAVTVDPADRARIQSILYVTVILFTSPFGWIAGSLSSINRVLPFLLNMALFAAGGVLVWGASRYQARAARVEPAENAA